MPCAVEKFLQQPGCGPQAARRRRAGELRSPRRLRRRACGPPAAPRKPCPHRAQQFSVYFLSKGVRFLRLMFFRRLCTFCGRDRTDSPSPAKKSDWIVFIHPCRLPILGLCSGEEKMVPVPRKGKPMGRFYPPSSLADFGLLRWGRIVPVPRKGKANGSFLSTLAACRFWAFAVGKNSPHPRKGKANGYDFYPLSPGSANCGVKPSPSRRRASSRAGCGGRAVK